MPDAFSLPASARDGGAVRGTAGAAHGPVGTPAPGPGRVADTRAPDGQATTADGAGTMGGGAGTGDGGGPARSDSPGPETGSAASLMPSVTLPKLRF